ncbi:MAG: TM0106 family RecB-like putative nuclease [Thermoleophilia bacterium]
MQLLDDGFRFSPSDLTAHLACGHLTTLSVAVARGELRRPSLESPHRELILRKGQEHERAYLARLVADGRSVVRCPSFEDGGFDAIEARRLTEQAIADASAEVIYQPYLASADGRWRGFADFLELQPDGGYEPVDTKLARRAKPAHLLQLLFYAEQVERLQGRPVERVHVENGRGERESFRAAEYAPAYRRARERFLAEVRAEPDTYPWPTGHCGICDFRRICRARLEQDDHPMLVAGMRRSLAEALAAAGVPTLASLGDLPPGSTVGDVRDDALEPLRHQAELQLRARRTGEHCWELLPDEEERGFRLLPEPSRGDVWLDLEGHPFFEPDRGLEFLFGWCYRDDAGEVVYEARWARDTAEEARAFAAFVDWVVERRARFPGLHVYHYAAYERSALTRLMGQHGLREREVDDILREDVLVDLYRVVKQGLRASTDSYSIKAIERLYGFVRSAEVGGGDEAVVRFEEWLEHGDDAALREVERYNEEDCRSTVELHRWLLAIRPPGLPWRPPPEGRERGERAEERDEERARLRDLLLAGDGPAEARQLLANLLDYHQREQRPQWWEWFRWPELTDEELVADRTAIGGLVWDGEPPTVEARSHAYRLTFPGQEHKIEREGHDPDSRRAFRARVDDDAGEVVVLRGTGRRAEPLPRALTPGRPIDDQVKREALLRFARPYAAGDRARYPALTALLERRPPAVQLGCDPVEAALSLDESYLFVQGPPGSGKTWQGARMAIALLRAGRRVGVTSLSHKAIHNLLRAIQHEADAQCYRFLGVKRAREEHCPDTWFESRCIGGSTDADVCADPSYALVAGTGWSLCRAGADRHAAERPIDVLFVDEAGQLALADVLAAATCARSVVLLGDPNQLPQVSQGSHPDGSELSVLQHLLGDEPTVPPDRGLFLAETWRLRPELCAFTSDAYYAGRLRHAEAAGRRRLATGEGPSCAFVEHADRSQSSIEEADAVAGIVAGLLGTAFTEEDGVVRPLTPADVLVVAPYNAQVRALRSRLPDAVQVGTVDRFQGQQAPVVIVSMASSTAEEAPRGIGFAFDAHRFNVATSRAQCRAILVCSPRLLDVDCRTIEQLRLVAAVCRFEELGRDRPLRAAGR